MLTDPQVVTVNAVAKSMPRIAIGDLQATYSKDDESYKLKISHLKSKKRIRTMARVDYRAVVADPLTAVNDYETLGIYVVIDRPEVAFSVTDVDNLVQGFKAWLTTTIVTNLYGLQS
jgi:hypothetical protein